MSRLLRAAVFTAVSALAAAAHAEERLLVTGSSTIAPVMNEIAKAFEAENPGVRIDVQSGGSGRGINDTRQGVANIGMVSRALKEDEQDLQPHLIGLDGITMIVHASNPITELTRDQIIGIYTGQIQDWSEVGGPAGPITVVNKAEGRSTLELFLNHFKLKAPQIKAQVIIGDNEEGIKVVSATPSAVDYISIGAAAYAATNGVPIRALPMEGVEPTVEAVATKKFPIIRELNLVTKGEPQGLAAKLIAFALTPESQKLIREFDYIPVAPAAP